MHGRQRTPCSRVLPSLGMIAFVGHIRPTRATTHRDEQRRRAFLFHGSIFERKGVTDLLEAFAQVNRLWPKSELWLIGDGDSLPTLMSRVRSLQLGHAARLSGDMLPASDVAGLLVKAHCVVVPSRLAADA